MEGFKSNFPWQSVTKILNCFFDYGNEAKTHRVNEPSRLIGKLRTTLLRFKYFRIFLFRLDVPASLSNSVLQIFYQGFCFKHFIVFQILLQWLKRCLHRLFQQAFSRSVTIWTRIILQRSLPPRIEKILL